MTAGPAGEVPDLGEEHYKTSSNGSLGRRTSCSGRLRQRLQELGAVGATVQRYPSVLLWPLVMLALVIGLGVFGVVWADQVAVKDLRKQAEQQAKATVSSFSLLVQKAYGPALSIGMYVAQQPDFKDLEPRFNEMASYLISQALLPPGLIQVELAPNGVIQNVYPDLVGGKGLDLLACCTGDVMREVEAGVLRIDGPYALEQGVRALIASSPVFINSVDNDTSWGAPPSKGSCTSPACFNATSGRKWWGTSYTVIFVDTLLKTKDSDFQSLREAGWSYELCRSAPPIKDPHTSVRPLLAQYGSLSDPVVASVALFGTEWSFLLAPTSGWSRPWRGPLIAFVVVGGCALAAMLFHMLLTRQQHTWLLHAMMPKSVVQSLKKGQEFAESYDACVLFADVVGFTAITSAMRPQDIVSMLNELFAAFEELTAEAGLTKVDIVGDCFIAVGGMPQRMAPEESAAKVAMLALAMVQCTEGLVTSQGQPLQLRVGVHAGPVVAAVVGARCPKFSIFGDVVNISARLQSTSLPGCVQASQEVADRLRRGSGVPGISLVERGVVELRNRGSMLTWWLLPEGAVAQQPGGGGVVLHPEHLLAQHQQQLQLPQLGPYPSHQLPDSGRALPDLQQLHASSAGWSSAGASGPYAAFGAAVPAAAALGAAGTTPEAHSALGSARRAYSYSLSVHEEGPDCWEEGTAGEGEAGEAGEAEVHGVGSRSGPIGAAAAEAMRQEGLILPEPLLPALALAAGPRAGAVARSMSGAGGPPQQLQRAQSDAAASITAHIHKAPSATSFPSLPSGAPTMDSGRPSAAGGAVSTSGAVLTRLPSDRLSPFAFDTGAGLQAVTGAAFGAGAVVGAPGLIKHPSGGAYRAPSYGSGGARSLLGDAVSQELGFEMAGSTSAGSGALSSSALGGMGSPGDVLQSRPGTGGLNSSTNNSPGTSMLSMPGVQSGGGGTVVAAGRADSSTPTATSRPTSASSGPGQRGSTGGGAFTPALAHAVPNAARLYGGTGSTMTVTSGVSQQGGSGSGGGDAAAGRPIGHLRHGSSPMGRASSSHDGANMQAHASTALQQARLSASQSMPRPPQALSKRWGSTRGLRRAASEGEEGFSLISKRAAGAASAAAAATAAAGGGGAAPGVGAQWVGSLAGAHRNQGNMGSPVPVAAEGVAGSGPSAFLAAVRASESGATLLPLTSAIALAHSSHPLPGSSYIRGSMRYVDRARTAWADSNAGSVSSGAGSLQGAPHGVVPAAPSPPPISFVATDRSSTASPAPEGGHILGALHFVTQQQHAAAGAAQQGSRGSGSNSQQPVAFSPPSSTGPSSTVHTAGQGGGHGGPTASLAITGVGSNEASLGWPMPSRGGSNTGATAGHSLGHSPSSGWHAALAAPDGPAPGVTAMAPSATAAGSLASPNIGIRHGSGSSPKPSHLLIPVAGAGAVLQHSYAPTPQSAPPRHHHRPTRSSETSPRVTASGSVLAGPGPAIAAASERSSVPTSPFGLAAEQLALNLAALEQHQRMAATAPHACVAAEPSSAGAGVQGHAGTGWPGSMGNAHHSLPSNIVTSSSASPPSHQGPALGAVPQGPTRTSSTAASMLQGLGLGGLAMSLGGGGGGGGGGAAGGNGGGSGAQAAGGATQLCTPAPLKSKSFRQSGATPFWALRNNSARVGDSKGGAGHLYYVQRPSGTAAAAVTPAPPAQLPSTGVGSAGFEINNAVAAAAGAAGVLLPGGSNDGAMQAGGMQAQMGEFGRHMSLGSSQQASNVTAATALTALVTAATGTGSSPRSVRGIGMSASARHSATGSPPLPHTNLSSVGPGPASMNVSVGGVSTNGSGLPSSGIHGVYQVLTPATSAAAVARSAAAAPPPAPAHHLQQQQQQASPKVQLQDWLQQPGAPTAAVGSPRASHQGHAGHEMPTVHVELGPVGQEGGGSAPA